MYGCPGGDFGAGTSPWGERAGVDESVEARAEQFEGVESALTGAFSGAEVLQGGGTAKAVRNQPGSVSANSM